MPGRISMLPEDEVQARQAAAAGNFAVLDGYAAKYGVTPDEMDAALADDPVPVAPYAPTQSKYPTPVSRRYASPEAPYEPAGSGFWNYGGVAQAPSLQPQQQVQQPPVVQQPPSQTWRNMLPWNAKKPQGWGGPPKSENQLLQEAGLMEAPAPEPPPPDPQSLRYNNPTGEQIARLPAMPAAPKPEHEFAPEGFRRTPEFRDFKAGLSARDEYWLHPYGVFVVPPEVSGHSVTELVDASGRPITDQTAYKVYNRLPAVDPELAKIVKAGEGLKGNALGGMKERMIASEYRDEASAYGPNLYDLNDPETAAQLGRGAALLKDKYGLSPSDIREQRNTPQKPEGVTQQDWNDIYPYVDYLRREVPASRGRAAEAFGEEAIQKAEEIDPMARKVAKSAESAIRVGNMNTGFAQALSGGWDSFWGQTLIPDVAATGDAKLMKAATDIQDYFAAAQEHNMEGVTGAKKILLEGTYIITPMIPSLLAEASNLIPVVGPVVGPVLTTMALVPWYKQGAAEVLMKVAEAGGDPKAAVDMSLRAGMLYAAIERMQLKMVGRAATVPVKETLAKTAIKFTGTRLFDFFKQLGEEGLQGSTAIGAFAKELQNQGFDVNSTDIAQWMVKEFGEEAVAATWGMGAISLAGGIIGGARMGHSAVTGGFNAGNAEARRRKATNAELRLMPGSEESLAKDQAARGLIKQDTRVGEQVAKALGAYGQVNSIYDELDGARIKSGKQEDEVDDAQIVQDEDGEQGTRFAKRTVESQEGQEAREADKAKPEDALKALHAEREQGRWGGLPETEHRAGGDRREEDRRGDGHIESAKEHKHVDYTETDDELREAVETARATVDNKYAPDIEKATVDVLDYASIELDEDDQRVVDAVTDPATKAIVAQGLQKKAAKERQSAENKDPESGAAYEGYGLVAPAKHESIYQKLVDADVPVWVEAFDVRNMKGLNTAAKSHGKADEHLRAIVGDVVIDTARKLGGIVSKTKGGDEFTILYPGYENLDALESARNHIERNARRVRDERQLDKTMYTRGENDDGTPMPAIQTGSGHTAFGFAKGGKGISYASARAAADNEAEKMKKDENNSIKAGLKNIADSENNSARPEKIDYTNNKGGSENGQSRSIPEKYRHNAADDGRGSVADTRSQRHAGVERESSPASGVARAGGREAQGAPDGVNAPSRRSDTAPGGEDSAPRGQSEAPRSGVAEDGSASLSEGTRAELKSLSPEAQEELRGKGLQFAGREGSNSTEAKSNTDAPANAPQRYRGREADADREVREILKEKFGAPLPAGSVRVSAVGFADWIHKAVKKAFNVDIVVLDIDQREIRAATRSAANRDGFLIDGFRSDKTPDKIYIASDNKRPLFQVISHELWHNLENNTELRVRVESALKFTRAGKRELARLTPSQTEEGVAEGYSEFTADYVFGKALDDESFWRALAAKNGFERFARGVGRHLRGLYVAMKRLSEDMNMATTGRYMTAEEFEDRRRDIGEHLINMRELFNQLRRAASEAKRRDGTVQAEALAKRFRVITGGAVVEAGEVETRNASRRSTMHPGIRRKRLAHETEDVPRDKQVVRFAKRRQELYEDAEKKIAKGDAVLDRLPLTTSFLESPNMKAMRGKRVKAVTVEQALNQKGVKEIEKELARVALEQFKGQPAFDYNEFEAAMRMSIVPLQRIETEAYADYGAHRLSGFSYADHKTVVLNMPGVEHGETGHFNHAFSTSEEPLKYVAKQLNDETWVAVEEDYAGRATEANIQQFVATAGNEEAVKNWIKKYEETAQLGEGRPRKPNAGLFGHFRVWEQDSGDAYIAELQSDYFQKHSAKKELPEEKKAAAVKKANIEAKEYPEVKDLNDRAIEAYNRFRDERIRMRQRLYDYVTEKTRGRPRYPVRDYMLSSAIDVDSDFDSRLVQEDVDELTESMDEAEKRDTIEFIKKLRKTLNEVKGEHDGIKEEMIAYQKKLNADARASVPDELSPEERQFTASQKTWERRLLHEAVRYAAEHGARRVMFPSPYAVARIEGYVESDEDASEEGPYSISYKYNTHDRLLQPGDAISDEYGQKVVVHSGSYEFEAYDIADARRLTYAEFLDEAMEKYLAGLEEDGIKPDEGRKAFVRRSIEADLKHARVFENGYYHRVTWDPFDGSEENVLVWDERPDAGPESENVVSYDQPSKNKQLANRDSFDASALPDSQRRVLEKYDEYRKTLAADFDGVETVDSGGVDWYGVDVSKGVGPVVAFARRKATTPDFAGPQPIDRNLVALHNLTGPEFLSAIELGGFPMPSIAVMKKKMPHNRYGGVTVVFGRETIDPQLDKDNKVYGGDAWTPAFPRVGLKFNDKRVRELEQRIHGILDNAGLGDLKRNLALDENNMESFVHSLGVDDLVDRFQSRPGMMAAFLIDRGETVEPIMREAQFGVHSSGVYKRMLAEIPGLEEAYRNNTGHDIMKYAAKVRRVVNDYYRKDTKGKLTYYEKPLEFAQMDTLVSDAMRYKKNGSKEQLDDYAVDKILRNRFNGDPALMEAFEGWLREMFNDTVEKRGIRNDRDPFTPSGNRRSFEQKHWEVTLDNIVRAMKMQDAKGASGSKTPAQVMASATEEFKNVDAIRGASGRLRKENEEEFTIARADLYDRIAEIAERMGEGGDFSGWNLVGDASITLSEMAAAAAKNPSRASSAIARKLVEYEGIAKSKISDKRALVADIRKVFEDVRNMPTEYFEAKPRRAVRVDEIRGAILPEGTDKKLLSALDENAIPHVAYNPDKKGDRAKKTIEFVDERKLAFARRKAPELGSAVEAGVPAERLDRNPNARKKVREEWEKKGTRSRFFKRWFGDWEADPANASKVVDENGEPLVVFHGARTLDDFYEFNSQRSQGKIFFTDNEDVARMFRSDHAYKLIVDGKAYNISERTADDIVKMIEPYEDVNWGVGWNLLDGADIEAFNGLIEDGTIQTGIDTFTGAEDIQIEPNNNGLFDVYLDIKNPKIIDMKCKPWSMEAEYEDWTFDGGHDGIIVKNVVEGGGAAEIDGEDVPPSTNYIVKSSNQVKSATDNAGTFDGGNSDIRFAKRGRGGNEAFVPVKNDVDSVSAAAERIEGLVGVELENKRLNLKGTISRNSLRKIARDDGAIKKSVSPKLHALAVANIKNLFEHAVIDVAHPDTKGGRDIEKIHRVGAFMLYEGETYPVKITLKRYYDQQKGSRIYSVEALTVEKVKSAGQLADAGETGSQAPIADFNTKIIEFLEKVNGQSEKSEKSSSPVKFAVRSGGAAERIRRERDPRWQIREALRGFLREHHVTHPRFTFDEAIAQWGRLPESARGDASRRQAWEGRWARVEDAFTRFARGNPNLFVDAGFPSILSALDDEAPDEFDPMTAVEAMREWEDDFAAGRYTTDQGMGDVEEDPLIAGRREAALRSLTEGPAPHESEAQYWDGNYGLPELVKKPLAVLAKNPELKVKGGDVVFTNDGTEFTAYRSQDGDGGWVIEDLYGEEKDLPYEAEIWIDAEQNHEIAKAYRAKVAANLKDMEHKSAVRELARVLAREFRRINSVRGARNSTLTLKANNAILDLIRAARLDFDGPTLAKAKNLTEFYQNLGNERIRNNRDAAVKPKDRAWVEGPDPLPERVIDDTEKIFAKAFDDMSTEGIAKLLAELKEVKAAGAFERKMEVLAETKRRNNNIKAMIARMDKTGKIRRLMATPPYAVVTEESGRARKAVARVGSFGSEVIWSSLRPERIFAYYDRISGKKDGLDDPSLLTNVVFKPLLASENARVANTETAVEMFKQTIAGADPLADQNDYLTVHEKPLKVTLRKLHRTTDKDGKTVVRSVVKTVKITVADAMFVYQHSQNKDGRMHLVGSGFTEDSKDGEKGSITQIVEALPKDRKQIVDSLIDYYDNDQYDRVNAVFEREHNVSMVKVDRYSPIRDLDPTGMSASEIIKAGDDFRRAGVKKGFTKGRVKSARPFNNFNFYTVNMSAILDAEKYIAYNDAIREANRYLSDEELSKAMKLKNKAAHNEIVKFLKDVAGSTYERPDWFSRGIRALARNYTVAKLGGNVLTWLKQPISGFQALPHISFPHVLKAMKDYNTNPIEMAAQIRNKSALMRNRADSIERVFVDMAERGVTKKLIQARLSTKMLASENARQCIDFWNTIMMKGIQTLDMYTAGVVWLAKYSETMERTNNSKAAIAAADKLVRTTQSQGGDLHLSSAFRTRNAALRTFTMFANDANQSFNILFDVFDGWKNRGGAKSAALLLYHVTVPAILMHIVTTGIAKIPEKWPWDDPEEWGKWILETLKRWASWEDIAGQIPGMVLGGVPVVGDIADFAGKAGAQAVHAAQGEGTKWLPTDLGTSPVQSALGDAQTVVANAIKGRADWEKLVDVSLALGGTAGYVPYKRIRGAVESDDPRRVLWSESTLKDRSVEAEMVKRADKDIMSDEYKRFEEWYNKLNKEERVEFNRRYERHLDEKAAADDERETEFKMMKESRVMMLTEDRLDAEKRSPTNRRLYAWALKRRDSWSSADEEAYSEWNAKQNFDREDKQVDKRGKAWEQDETLMEDLDALREADAAKQKRRGGK